MPFIYSTLLGRCNQSTGGNTALFTAASTGTTVIRDISVRNGAATATHWILLINGNGYGPEQDSMPVNSSYQWQGRMVLAQNDVVSFYTPAGFGACMVSGYVLA